MSSIGLVLGAGGVPGLAFHAGVLAAVADATGWDPRQAELIVGTSAGAHVAAHLRGGLSAADLHARAADRALSPEGAALLAASADPIPDDELGPRPPWGYLPQAPWLVGPALLRPGVSRWGVVVAGLLPAGRRPTDVLGRTVRSMHTGRWPDAPTWVVAYRTRDGRRVVFGRDDVEVSDLATAVEASSAVPARFAPVQLPSGRYLDGAVFSPSNVDLVAGLGFDLVVVSSPMTATSGALDGDNSLGAQARRWFGSLTTRETDAVARAGTPVLLVEPDADVLAAMAAPGDERERAPAIADAAHRAAIDRLADLDAASAVSLLSA